MDLTTGSKRVQRSVVWLLLLGMVAAVGIPNFQQYSRRAETRDLYRALTQLQMASSSDADQQAAATMAARQEYQRLVESGVSPEYLAPARSAIELYERAHTMKSSPVKTKKVQDVQPRMAEFVFSPDEIYGPVGKMVHNAQKAEALMLVADNQVSHFGRR